MRVSAGDNGEKRKRQIYLPGLFLFKYGQSLLTPPID
jgi:hypothetical protein